MTVRILRQSDIALLRNGKERIKDPAHWCTGYYVDNNGPNGECRYCAKGALYAGHPPIAMSTAAGLLDEAAFDLFSNDYGLDHFIGVVFVNDELRDHRLVMKVYDRAIEIGEKRLAEQEVAA